MNQFRRYTITYLPHANSIPMIPFFENNFVTVPQQQIVKKVQQVDQRIVEKRRIIQYYQFTQQKQNLQFDDKIVKDVEKDFKECKYKRRRVLNNLFQFDELEIPIKSLGKKTWGGRDH